MRGSQILPDGRVIGHCLTIAALPLILASCRSHVDEIRMRIDQSEQGALTAQISGTLTENEMDDPDNSELFEEMNNVGSQLTQGCNVRHVLFTRQNIVRLDLRAGFADADDLNSTLDCAALNIDEPSVEFERHDGFFWNTFIVRFAISERNERCTAMGECVPARVFPSVILLTVPGEVHAFNDLSQLVGINVGYRRIDDDTVRVEIGAARDYRAANLRYFTNRRDDVRRDEVKLEVVSRVANYNLSIIISVIGMVFGSGLLIQASRWALFRRKEKAISEA
jgi:hypothetical protein